MELVIGTRRWSTWSMRPWLALKRTGVPFTETLITLRQENDQSMQAILAHSPSGLVPALKVDGMVIVDSLAICEYLHDSIPEAKLWPKDRALRALGRSAAAEMHAGFAALRSEHPMALEVPVGVVAPSEAVAKNVKRIVRVWGELLQRSGGPFLLGAWSIADAFYTPVATRFRTYGFDLSDLGDTGAGGDYAVQLLNTPEFLEWERAALAETI